jgi:hypothetical protein
MPNEVLIHIKGKDETGPAFKTATKGASGLGSALGTASGVMGGMAIMGAGQKIFGFLEDSTQAAIASEESWGRLQKAVENTGTAYADAEPSVKAAIQGAKDMGFSGTAARDGLALLEAQTGDNAEAIKRFALAQDLARGANIDITTASKLLGKVTDENVNVLGRYGIAAKEGMTETELFGMVQEKFGGQAQTFAESTAGKMALLSTKMGDLKVQIGTALLPVIQKLASFALDTLLPAIKKLAAEWIPKLKEGFQKVSEVIAPVVEKIKSFIEPIAKNKEVLKYAGFFLGTVLVGAFAALAIAAGSAAISVIAATAPFIAIAAAVALVAYGVYQLIKHWDDITAAVGNFLEMIKGVPVLGDIVSAVEAVVRSTIEDIVGYFQGLIDIGKEIISFFKNVFKGDWDAALQDLKDIGMGILKSLVDWIKLGFIDEIIGMLKGFIPWDAVKGAIGDIRDKINAAFQAVLDFLKEHWPEIAAIISGPFFPIVALATDAFGVRTALQNAMTAVKDFVFARVGDIVGFFTALPGQILATGIDLFNKAKIVGEDLMKGITDGLKELPGKMLAIGGDIVRGIWDGIVGLTGWLKDQLSAWVTDNIPGWMKEILGISSPAAATVPIGKAIVNGMVVGIQSATPALTAALASTIAEVNGIIPDAAADALRMYREGLASTIADGGIAPIPSTGLASTIAEPGGVIPAAAAESLAIWRATQKATETIASTIAEPMGIIPKAAVDALVIYRATQVAAEGTAKATSLLPALASGTIVGLGGINASLKDIAAYYLEAIRSRLSIVIDAIWALPGYLSDIVSAINNISIPSAQGGASVIKAGLLGVHANETIVPAGHTMQTTGTGGGKTEIHMHVQGSILSERDLEKVIADAFRHGKFRGMVTA